MEKPDVRPDIRIWIFKTRVSGFKISIRYNPNIHYILVNIQTIDLITCKQ